MSRASLFHLSLFTLEAHSSTVLFSLHPRRRPVLFLTFSPLFSSSLLLIPFSLTHSPLPNTRICFPLYSSDQVCLSFYPAREESKKMKAERLDRTFSCDLTSCIYLFYSFSLFSPRLGFSFRKSTPRPASFFLYLSSLLPAVTHDIPSGCLIAVPCLFFLFPSVFQCLCACETGINLLLSSSLRYHLFFISSSSSCLSILSSSPSHHTPHPSDSFFRESGTQSNQTLPQLLVPGCPSSSLSLSQFQLQGIS